MKWTDHGATQAGTFLGLRLCRLERQAQTAQDGGVEFRWAALTRRWPWQSWRDVGTCREDWQAAQIAEHCRRNNHTK
jgi:hypothetical protein